MFIEQDNQSSFILNVHACDTVSDLSPAAMFYIHQEINSKCQRFKCCKVCFV